MNHSLNHSLRLAPVLSVSALCDRGELVAFNVGPDGSAYFVFALNPLDDREVRPNGSVFAKTRSDRPQSYRVIGVREGSCLLDARIEDEPFNIHDIQPVGEELLLVCARCRYRGPGDADRNGRVYNRDGQLTRELLLGDGIKGVQATTGGVVWTSYFDEGIFGNFGWEQPIGSSGLIAWDSSGRRLYEFEPIPPLDWMCGCYALNVESEEDV